MLRKFFHITVPSLFIGAFFSSAKAPQTKLQNAPIDTWQDELLHDYAEQLECPDEYKLQMLFALSHYPELKNTPIVVKFANLETTATCRPDLFSVFTGRKYIIQINKKENFSGVLLKDVPFNAQIGVLAHEIAHIVDYEQRSHVGLLKRALDYLEENRKKRFENQIDKLTIEHGLGWQLYEWADYAMNKSKATEKYKEFKRRIYMGPADIERHIHSLSFQ